MPSPQGGTLNLKEKAQPTPVFKPREHFGEVAGIPGVKYVQGDNFFNVKHQFVRKSGEEHALAPLTREQEIDRLLRQRDQAARATVIGGGEKTNVPQHIVDAERENQRAAGAENLSE